MGLGTKTSSVLAYSGRAARARAGPTRALLSNLSTTAQSRTWTSAGRPCVLYIDRGVIVLNKPPGLVAQGTSSAAPIAAKSHRPETTTQPRTAFDYVLQGTAKTCSITFAYQNHGVECLSANDAALELFLTFRSPTGLWPQYKSVSGPSTRQGTVRTLKRHHSFPSDRQLSILYFILF